MSQETIERLNYFDGQRLEAEDLRLEQQFHIRIQRWLSKSLFSAGVADGLEVFPVEDPETGKTNKVLVTPGLALDDLGRAIILVKAVELVPQARFLCVRYGEHKERVQEAQCAVRGPRPVSVARSGGPERIVSDAEFTWRTAPPRHDTRELVIAEIQLDEACEVRAIVDGAQHVAVATQVSRVFPLALEGEKDIATGTPKAIIFHITGRKPNRVLLCLRGLPISQLYYSELAEHTHSASDLTLPPHTHSLAAAKTDKDGNHTHAYYVRQQREAPGQHLVRDVSTPFPTSVGGISGLMHEVLVSTRASWVAGVVLNVNPTLNFALKSMTEIGAEEGLSTVPTHVHGFKANERTGAALSSQGAAGPVAIDKPTIDATGMHLRPEQGAATVLDSTTPLPKSLFHVRGLQVTYDGTPITDAILDRIRETDPANYGNWQGQLGNGDSTHPLAVSGTELIRIDDLDLGGKTIATNRGEHTIELSVSGARNGGCIHYNLYVE